MKDLNADCNGNGRHLFYGENNVENRQCYTTSIQRTVSDAQTGHDKNGLKRKLLEHDAIFKNQVYDLHRLYRTQRDMMEYRKTKEGHIHGDCSKDYRVSEARSSKVRKKSIDLQLPADEYSVTEEYNGRLENSDFVREKMDRLQEGCSSVSNTRISIGLADLNEPAEIEEAAESSSIKIFGQFARSGPVKGIDFSAKHNFSTENNVNGSKWPRFSYEAGATPSKVVSQDHPPGFHLADHSQETTGKERMAWGLEGFHRSQEYANHTRREPTVNSQPSSSYQFLGSSVMSPKLTSFHSQNPSRGINKTLQENWYVNNSPHSNTALTRNPPSFNGFYHASSSGSKDSPVFGFDRLNCGRGATIASSLVVNHDMEKVYMDSSCIDKRKQKDFNLNETFPGNALNEDHKPLLPWLRAKQACNSETANSRKDVIFISSSPPPTGKDINGIWPKNERYETQSEKKILGVPIFQRLGASENEASSLTSSASGRENAKREKNFLIDINVACDDSLLESGDESEVFVEKVVESSRVKNFIDLNTCVTEDEDFSIPNGKSSNTQTKFVADFDLEMPAVPEEEDNLPESEQLDNEVLMSAAKAIVEISSSAVEFESLLLFAHVVASTSDKLDKECSYKMDDFEAMTLLLPDTKEEDLMPKLFVPELQVEEARGNAHPGRPRRGQARRGRHRRDFQRDILPGLATLSRHEMTEDLQTFGGLMKVTGHVWNSGLMRRSGGSRGRRRKAVEVGDDSQQVKNEENSLEDKRSLTGWGKTTRRPRRQRCPASNAPTVALT